MLSALPLLLAVFAIAILVASQSRQLAQREIAALERQLIEAKRAELRNYLSIARTAIGAIYGNALPDDEYAKLQVKQILASLLYGQDGYFFVFDYDGTNLVAPRQTHLINENWQGLTDSQGTPITRAFVDLARSGGGYHTHLWWKPSTASEAQMISYVIGLQDWRWAIGTGIFIDDVQATVAAAKAEVEARIEKVFVYIGAIALVALLGVFVSGLWLTRRERQAADAKLKLLTQRIVDTQEEERSRVARELHDGISQMLVGVRYTLELAGRRLTRGDQRASDSLATAMQGLKGALSEVRRISHDLRPGVLDDLGLGPALHSLTEDFRARTGIDCQLETVVFRNRLDDEAKIALYRIAQEALTNIERHAQASVVTLRLFGHRRGATLRIQDDGVGLAANGHASPGLGLRNMQERMEQLDGSLRILGTPQGTLVEAQVPLSHLLPPQSSGRATA